jgi:hypothetical protein
MSQKCKKKDLFDTTALKSKRYRLKILHLHSRSQDFYSISLIVIKCQEAIQQILELNQPDPLRMECHRQKRAAPLHRNPEWLVGVAGKTGVMDGLLVHVSNAMALVHYLLHYLKNLMQHHIQIAILYSVCTEIAGIKKTKTIYENEKYG